MPNEEEGGHVVTTFPEKEGAAPQESRPEVSTQTEKGRNGPDLDSINHDESLDGSVLDRVITMTKFLTMGAKRKYQAKTTLRQFGSYMPSVEAASKDRLPWYKMATFGDQRTERGCLRSNPNMVSVDGAEIDYDAGLISPHGAFDMLLAAHVGGLLYSTPSATADCHKWRFFAPFSRTLAPKEREKHVARLNGVFGGVIDGASFTMSQAFYAGNVEGKASIEVLAVEGRAIDLCDDLDAGALGRNGKPWKPKLSIRSCRRNLPSWQAGDSHGLNQLERIAKAIAGAPFGMQEATLNSLAWQAGRLIEEGRVNSHVAFDVLERAAAAMPSEPGRRPWQHGELTAKIRRGMEAGR